MNLRDARIRVPEAKIDPLEIDRLKAITVVARRGVAIRTGLGEELVFELNDCKLIVPELVKGALECCARAEEVDRAECAGVRAVCEQTQSDCQNKIINRAWLLCPAWLAYRPVA